MPIDYTIDQDAHLVRVRCVGDLTIDGMIQHSLRVNDDARFIPGMDTLTDMREATLVDDVAAIRNYVDHSAELEQFRGACKWACLVADESAIRVIWSFNLNMSDRGSTIETCGFLEESEALAWLAAKENGQDNP